MLYILFHFHVMTSNFLTNTVVSFSHLIAIAFFKTCKILKVQKLGLYWLYVAEKNIFISLACVNHRPYFRHLIEKTHLKYTQTLRRGKCKNANSALRTHYFTTISYELEQNSNSKRGGGACKQSIRCPNGKRGKMETLILEMRKFLFKSSKTYFSFKLLHISL